MYIQTVLLYFSYTFVSGPTSIPQLPSSNPRDLRLTRMLPYRKPLPGPQVSHQEYKRIGLVTQGCKGTKSSYVGLYIYINRIYVVNVIYI